MRVRTAPAPAGWKRLLLPLAAVGYVAALAVWVDRGAEPRAWLLGCASLALAWIAARRERRVAMALGTCVAAAVASLGAVSAHAGVEAVGGGAAGLAAVAASLSTARLPGEGRILRPIQLVARPWIVAILALTAFAFAAHFAPASGPRAWLGDHPAAWPIAAEAATIAVVVGQVEWTRLRRRLELGVLERVTSLRALITTTCVAAIIWGLLERPRLDDLTRAALAAVSLVIGAVALARDPVAVARRTRRVTVLAFVGGGVAMLGAMAMEGRATEAALVVSVALLAIGAGARALEGPVRPARGAWLDAFAQASVEAGRGDPDDAIRAALHALRAPGGPQGASPELWTFGPTRVTTVDAAGYARERDGEMPEELVLVATGEPEATLRVEVLDALEVRRADLRPLGRWMNERMAMLATVVTCEGETDAVLVLPRAPRDEPVTLEEVRALKDTADRLAAPVRARATQARMLARAHEAMLRAEAAEEATERLRHQRRLDAGRDVLAATRLARPATVGVYSAASRFALEALEKRTAVGAPVAVVAPSGVDPVPYLARAHLSGARKGGPLVLVDATSAREHDPSRWNDPAASPLALADGGMLVLLDGAALPVDIQQTIARALAEKRAPWERPDPLDVQLALTATEPPSELVTLGRLDGGLASRLADASTDPVELPRLRDRGGDLRALLNDRLAREGLRVHGRPVGIEQAAFARLVDYPFPGEDAELSAVVQRLVARCIGDVVRAADVDSLSLGAASAAEEPTRRKNPLSA